MSIHKLVDKVAFGFKLFGGVQTAAGVADQVGVVGLGSVYHPRPQDTGGANVNVGGEKANGGTIRLRPSAICLWSQLISSTQSGFS
jgi:hypothetical protein